MGHRSGVLDAHDGPDAPWRFLHRALRDALSAELLGTLPDPAQVAAKLPAASVGRWGETFALVADGLPDPATLIRTVGQSSEALAHRMLKEVDSLAPLDALALADELGGDAEVQHHLARDHRMAGQLGRVLASRRGTNLALRAAGSTDWTRRNFARWMFEDYPRALIATPKRWHRRMFTGPGAYRGRPLDGPHDGTAMMPGHQPLAPGPDEPVHGSHGS